MPLEISEIGVNVAVGKPQEPSPGAPASGDDGQAAGAGAALSSTQVQGIVSRCVQQVLARLRALRAR